MARALNEKPWLLHDDTGGFDCGRGHLMSGLRLLGVKPRLCVMHKGANRPGYRIATTVNKTAKLNTKTSIRSLRRTKGLRLKTGPPMATQANREGLHDGSSSHDVFSTFYRRHHTPGFREPNGPTSVAGGHHNEPDRRWVGTYQHTRDRWPNPVAAT